MTNPNISFLTRKDSEVGEGDFDSIAWAFETHVKAPDTGEYQTAVLYGNEDAPERIEFFKNADPNHDEVADYIWIDPDFSHHYQVVVGNLGTVYTGANATDAATQYAAYVEISLGSVGRTAGQPVTMLQDGEPVREHTPPETAEADEPEPEAALRVYTLPELTDLHIADFRVIAAQHPKDCCVGVGKTEIRVTDTGTYLVTSFVTRPNVFVEEWSEEQHMLRKL